MDAKVADLVTNEHGVGFEAWAQMWGMNYVLVKGIEDFDFEPGDLTTVVEVIPDARQTEQFWSALR